MGFIRESHFLWKLQKLDNFPYFAKAQNLDYD